MNRTGLLLAIVLAGCSRPPQATPPPDAGSEVVLELTAAGLQNAEVRVAKLAPGAFAPRLRVNATISGDPKGIARLGSRAAGRVTRIHVALGDTVRKGQPLVELDAVEAHKVALDFATAKAQARVAEDALTRQRQLVAERIGSQAELRRAEADAAAAAAALHESEEHLHTLGLSAGDVVRDGQLTDRGSRSTLRSPIDGRVSALDVSIGQVLQGTEDIVTITQLDKLWVDLRVYERDLQRLVRGTAIEVRALAYPEQTFRGTIVFVGDLLDPATRTVQARATLDGIGPLRPGMTATALVALPTDGTTLWVPVEAIQKHDGQPIVFVRVGERRFAPRPVVVGTEQGGFAAIRSGISVGADVVVHGALALRAELERAELEH